MDEELGGYFLGFDEDIEFLDFNGDVEEWRGLEDEDLAFEEYEV